MGHCLSCVRSTPAATGARAGAGAAAAAEPQPEPDTSHLHLHHDTAPPALHHHHQLQRQHSLSKSEMNEIHSQRGVRRKSSSEGVQVQIQTGARPSRVLDESRKGDPASGSFPSSVSVRNGDAIRPTPVSAADPSRGSRPSGERQQRSFCLKINGPKSVFGMGSGESKSSDARIESLFEQYRDPNEDAILSEGIERLCGDLGLKPDEFRVLVLAWKLGAEVMCRFTRGEFCRGLRAMRVDSIAGIRGRLPEIVEELRGDDETFRDLYRFTFGFGLDVVAGQRILPAEVAIVMWRLVFSGREPPILDRWLNYLSGHPHIRGIPKDTWYMFLNFADAVGEDLGGYDDAEAWPSLFDDFVEYENDQTNQNVPKGEGRRISD